MKKFLEIFWNTVRLHEKNKHQVKLSISMCKYLIKSFLKIVQEMFWWLHLQYSLVVQ